MVNEEYARRSKPQPSGDMPKPRSRTAEGANAFKKSRKAFGLRANEL